MRELALHVLDLVQNSIRAAASLIEIGLLEDPVADRLVLRIVDNGKGIPEEKLSQVTSPFFTSRTTREVGLGLSLLEQAVKLTQGELQLKSKEEQGTELAASFTLSHLDRPPLGDLTGTLMALIVPNPELDFVYEHCCGERCFKLDTREIKRELNGVAINHPEVVKWLRSYVTEGIQQLRGGKG